MRTRCSLGRGAFRCGCDRRSRGRPSSAAGRGLGAFQRTEVHASPSARILRHCMTAHAAVVFELNGQSLIVNDVDPHCTLLEWLRASGRTGTKEGCAEGECGACAVAFVGRDALGQPRYEAVNSCLVSLPEVHGRRLISVEGVAGFPGPVPSAASQPAELHPVQQALVETGGSQCGYCTPGFVMSLFAEYYRPDRSDFDPEAIGGNLCRC